MGKKSKAPKPPDPYQTAAAQTEQNVSTAIANATLNNVNQVTPYGSLTYNQIGTETITGPDGQTYQIPRYQATQELTEIGQETQDQSDQASLNFATAANNQTANLVDTLSTPLSLDNEATESRLMELGRARLDPVLAEQDEALRTRLANQGIRAGSEAYDREMRNQNQSRNDAYNQLMLTGRNQAVNELLTERNQPVNEITALMSGSQVQQPNFVNTNMPQVANTDIAGLVQDNYNARLNQYNQQQAQRNSLYGGLFGLGSAAIMASDKRVKTKIKPAGKVKGHKVYEYEYKARPGEKHIGVMAQEAEKKRPDAVIDMGGVKHVNYGSLFGIGAQA